MFTLIVTVIYANLFILSEFRLKGIKFLTNVAYMTSLLIYIFIILAADYFYYIPGEIYFDLVLIGCMQVCGYISRIYLWKCHGDNIIRLYRLLRPINNREDEYYPRSVNFLDFVVMGLLALYLYLTVDSLRK